MTADTKSLSLVGGFAFEGPAVERDRTVLERNNHSKVEEAMIRTSIRDQNDAFSDSEAEFFAELRRRQTAV